MSLILDALNKADREDGVVKDAVPDLNTKHNGPIVGNKNRTTFILIIAVSVLFVVVVGLLIAFLVKGSDSGRGSPQIKATVPAVQPTFQATAQPADQSSDRVQSPQPTVQKITKVDNLNPPNSPQEQTRSAHTHSELTSAAIDPVQIDSGQVDTEISALYSEQTVAETVIKPRKKPPTASAGSTQSTVDEGLAQALWNASEVQKHTPLPVSAAQQDTTIKPAPKEELAEEEPVPDAPEENTLAGYAKTPFLHEMSVNIQNTIPTLMYSEHQYVNGYVTLNRQTIQAGESVKEGVVVERILADGVILKYESRRFKLSSLSSWVNF